MAVTFLMTTERTTDCGYIHIADATTYPNNDPRSNYGIAWFVFEDGSQFAENLNNEDTWDVAISNNHIYTIYGFLVSLWVNGTPSDDGCIRFYNDTFYLNDSGGVLLTEPGTSGSGWTVLTDSDYLDFVNSLCIQMQSATEEIDCPDYVVQKQSCYVHQICDNSSSSSIKQVTLTDYEGNVISTDYIDPNLATCYDIDLTSEGDGVYILSIQTGTYISGEFVSDGEEPQYLVIYEYCGLENCTWFTIDKILCSGDPCAEICNPCNPDTIKQQQKDRQALNQLIATFGTLMSRIHVERIRYLGIFDWNTQRSTYVTSIGMMLAKVKELAIRCGMCYGQTVNNPNSDNVTFTAVITTATSSRTCTDCQ